MKSLSKATIAEKAGVSARLVAAAERLRSEIETYDAKVAALFDDVESARTAYNEAVDEANEWIAGVHSEMDGYASDRSEKWTESEVGEAFATWMGEYELELEHAEISAPDSLDVPDLAELAIDDLSDAP